MTEKQEYTLKGDTIEVATVKRFLGVKTKTLKTIGIVAGAAVGAGLLYKVISNVTDTDIIEDVVEELVD